MVDNNPAAMPSVAQNPLDLQAKQEMVKAIYTLVTTLMDQTPLQRATRVIPSASTDGEPIKIAATSTPGTLFHTANATALDEIWMFITNTSATARLVTIEYGDATSPDHNILVSAPADDTVLVLAGTVLTNSKTVKAFAAAANVVNMFGYVNRLT
jgi:hypothetical protein